VSRALSACTSRADCRDLESSGEWFYPVTIAKSYALLHLGPEWR
jgi:hypothetical protein